MPPALTRLLLTLTLVYLVVISGVFLFQRNLLFQPFPGPETPAEAGLSGYSRAFFAAPDGAKIPYWYYATPSPKGTDILSLTTVSAERSEGGVNAKREGAPRASHANANRDDAGASSTPVRATRAPIILYFHGNGGGLHAFTGPLSRLSAEGFAVAAMEYRGFPAAPPHPSEKAIIADAIAFAAHLRTQYPNRPLVLWGYSLGSAVAVQLAAALDYESAVILEAPFTSAVARGAEIYPFLPVRWLMRDPFDSLSRIAHIGSPLFIMHGDSDLIVPAAHGRALYDAARAPKHWALTRDRDHFDLIDSAAFPKAFAFITTHTTP